MNEPDRARLKDIERKWPPEIVTEEHYDKPEHHPFTEDCFTHKVNPLALEALNSSNFDVRWLIDKVRELDEQLQARHNCDFCADPENRKLEGTPRRHPGERDLVNFGLEPRHDGINVHLHISGSAIDKQSIIRAVQAAIADASVR